jgi:hypothetical protein
MVSTSLIDLTLHIFLEHLLPIYGVHLIPLRALTYPDGTLFRILQITVRRVRSWRIGFDFRILIIRVVWR